jgi:hypothetical protein
VLARRPTDCTKDRVTPKYKLHRAGLGPIRRAVTVNALDTSQEACSTLDRILMAGTPTGRLQAVKQRATQHPNDLHLADEIAWVEQRLAHQNGNAEMADLFALTAIERGLDLLHTEQHLAAVLEVERRRIADELRGDTKARLPAADRLLAMINEMHAEGHGSKATIKATLAARYGVTKRAVNLRIKNLPGSN